MQHCSNIFKSICKIRARLRKVQFILAGVDVLIFVARTSSLGEGCLVWTCHPCGMRDLLLLDVGDLSISRPHDIIGIRKIVASIRRRCL